MTASSQRTLLQTLAFSPPGIVRFHIGEESVKQAINALPQGTNGYDEKIVKAKAEVNQLMDQATPEQLDKLLNFSRELLG